MGHLFAILILVALPQVPTPREPGVPAKCTTSADPTYGLTPANPVQIAGGAMYVAASEERYLAALRGPDGQAIQYTRIGSRPQSANNPTILDRYDVWYDGLEKPISLYLDVYHYWEPSAPMGLSCGQAPRLQPMADRFQANDSLVAVAIEQGATREFEPIPLDADGSGTHGMMWDGFRTIAMRARAAAAAGKPLSPATGRTDETIVLAYPLLRDGRRLLPVAIEFGLAEESWARRIGEFVKSDGISALLPGTIAPAGSLAATFFRLIPYATDRVRITYTEAGRPEATEVVLPLNYENARVTVTHPPVPKGANPAENLLLLQALIDLDGTLQRITYRGGPAHLLQPAIDAVKTWRAVPAAVNGAPVALSGMLIEVRFR